MQKVPLFIISAIIVTFIFESCKKDKATTSTQTTIQKIQVKWGIESIVDHVYSPTHDTTTTGVGTTADYMDFRTDGKVYFYFEGAGDTATYALVGDTTILITLLGNYKIQALTDQILKLYDKEPVPSVNGYLEQTINLKK